ncbi:MAG TPA: glycosyltransferase [Gemmataceae bacterium]|nr:glycosyltransferase [Gemmataceae bacterium]
MSLLKRLKLEFEDWMRYDPRIRRTLARYQAWRTRDPDPGDTQAVARTIVKLCAAARLAEDVDLERRIQDRIVTLVGQLDASRIDWTEFASDYADPRLYKAAVLKPYVGPREKGVLFISFETLWIRLLRPANYRELAERYTIVVQPSSSPPHVIFNYAFPALFPGPVFTLISNPNDLAVFPRMSPNLVTVPLYASSWVNPELFQLVPKAERTWDLLMVANFAKFKRHFALFAALRSLPMETRILLIGQNQDGRDADTIRETARWYGVADRFTLLSNQPYPEVTRAFCQTRASVVLSKREGSCVAIVESMFADAPAAMLRNAGIGSRAFINEQTGRFLDEASLARDLAEFVRDADRYSPRGWAEQNISCWRSSQILNDLLKAKALELGHDWTRDIAPMQWSPDPVLARSEDRPWAAAERADVLQRFGLEIGPPPVK